jgi:Zn-dependent protease
MGFFAKFMRGGICLGTLFGSKVYVNTSWFAMYALLVGMGYLQGVVMLPVIIFPCLGIIILMHEYGHALTARAFGIHVPDITLGFMGGVAILDGSPEKGWQEVVIAIAGPAVNVVLASIAIVLLYAKGALVNSTSEALFNEYPFHSMMIMINVMIAVFNLTPAFPMDGGRVLRGSLTHFMDYRIATKIAAWVGIVFAGVFMMLWVTGTVNGIALPIIAFFLFTVNHNLIRMGGEDRPAHLKVVILEQIDTAISDIEIEITKLLGKGVASDSEEVGVLQIRLARLKMMREEFVKKSSSESE